MRGTRIWLVVNKCASFLGPSQPVEDHDIEAKVQRSELFSLNKRNAVRLHQKLRYWSKAFNLVFIMYVQSVERKSYCSAILLPFMRIALILTCLIL